MLSCFVFAYENIDTSEIVSESATKCILTANGKNPDSKYAFDENAVGKEIMKCINEDLMKTDLYQYISAVTKYFPLIDKVHQELCYDNTNVGSDMLYCAESSYYVYDEILNKVYKNVLKIIKENKKACVRMNIYILIRIFGRTINPISLNRKELGLPIKNQLVS